MSSRFGLILHRDLPARMARALCGVALVTVVDDDAAWELTQALGKQFSCYGGAVRLYWPGFKLTDSPFKHPLWTAERILEHAVDVEDAVARTCGMLRRRLMATSVASLDEPHLIRAVRRAAETERLTIARRQLGDEADYKALAESYFDDIAKLEDEKDQLKAKLTSLRQQLYRVQSETAWADAPVDIQQGESSEPQTVADAVARAKVHCAATLTFGDDVDRGVADLAPDAGPPAKVLAYLTKLSEMALARRDGELGKGMVLWLNENGATASTESETIANSKTEQRKRTWHDGTSERTFEYHLKPNDGVHPDRCVRIYFDWDDVTEKVVVGWVGRHP